MATRLRPTPRTLRMLVRIGIALVAIAALVVAPVLYASQPSFLARYSNLSAPYKAWTTSTHKDVACESCHVPPTVVARAAFSARMLGEYYLSLVSSSRELDVLRPPTNASCQPCHADLVSVSPSGDLKIPHRAHVDVLKMSCVECHDYAVHEKNAKGTHVPPMTACLTCHDGKRAKSACTTCHTAKAAPDTHKATDWVVVHPLQQTGGECAKCHAWTKNWCADCHFRRPASHSTDWRKKHATAVKGRRNCEACHPASFCVRCHGVVPQLNYNPATKLVK
ncbi:MAG: cytochrome c3 family protein [Actinomycetota bacterium]|nr:MAG: NapC/NirT cytochrome c domain [Actinomycetota bacterium]MDP3630398.1 cytochrome c3 family protein [Actinomycetota bacterium]